MNETFDLRRARVVDVAGGKGTLAYDVLQRTEAAEVCVIDPRRMRRGRLRRRWRDRLDRLRRDEDEDEGAGGREVREPKHVRVYFTHAVWEGDEASVRASYELARASRWCVKGLVADGGGTYEVAANEASRVKVTNEGVFTPIRDRNYQWSNEDDDKDDDKDDADEEEPDLSADETRAALLDVLERCTHVIAMHPDQATDAAIDFAIERRLPFAIVPCCVYSKDFPHRRLRSGARVSTHRDLVDHLVERAFAVDVHARELPFPGKNIVVYGTGARRDACAPCLERPA